MSLETLFSPSWYRVAGLQPRLRNHTQIHRHNYRGKLWYVIQDHSSGRNHRISPSAYYIVAQMDGKKTFNEIWELALNHLGDDAPTQDEMIRLASQLHASDTLLCDVPPDTLELFQRHETHEKARLKQLLMSPLSLRFPLFDPDRFLNRYREWVRPLFGWFGALLWLGMVGYAVSLAGVHWEGLTKSVADRVLTPENLLLLWLVYPVVKLLHEFGHAFAAKYWGGEVHEMGIMLLVFVPVPYVEASSSSAFPEKHKRMLVDAAGILVELFLAAVAMVVWVNAEPGWVHATAYNVILIGSVSTLFFNGNPLLRFDGYYFLSDALEIPNLATRSVQYIGYLIQKYAFGVKLAKPPAESASEKFWLFTYGVLAFIYRLFVITAIALFVAEKFFIVGVLLAGWAVFGMVALPLYRKIIFLVRSPMITGHRIRAVFLSAIFIGLLGGLVFGVPVPYATRSEGVVWPPENSLVRAGTPGFCKEVLFRTHSKVKKGDALIVTDDPLLRAEIQVLKKRKKELEAEYFSLRMRDRTQAEIKKEEIKTISAELERSLDRERQLIIRSPTNGTLVLPKSEDMNNRFLNKGEWLGYVVKFPMNTVRVVIPQDKIGMVREQTRKVQVRLAEQIDPILEARILREVPAATRELPSVALGFAGGGEVPIDPSDEGGTRAFESIFQLDLVLLDHPPIDKIGERIYVRFDHGSAPLYEQWYRMVRQLFLKRFNV